jgi:hypothetical protein
MSSQHLAAFTSDETNPEFPACTCSPILTELGTAERMRSQYSSQTNLPLKGPKSTSAFSSESNVLSVDISSELAIRSNSKGCDTVQPIERAQKEPTTLLDLPLELFDMIIDEVINAQTTHLPTADRSDWNQPIWHFHLTSSNLAGLLGTSTDCRARAKAALGLQTFRLYEIQIRTTPARSSWQRLQSYHPNTYRETETVGRLAWTRIPAVFDYLDVLKIVTDTMYSPASYHATARSRYLGRQKLDEFKKLLAIAEKALTKLKNRGFPPRFVHHIEIHTPHPGMAFWRRARMGRVEHCLIGLEEAVVAASWDSRVCDFESHWMFSGREDESVTSTFNGLQDLKIVFGDGAKAIWRPSDEKWTFYRAS